MSIWTQADVDALKAAVGSGVLQVRYDGPPHRTVVYHSLREMRELLAAMVADVAASQGHESYRFASTRKGV